VEEGEGKGGVGEGEKNTQPTPPKHSPTTQPKTTKPPQKPPINKHTKPHPTTNHQTTKPGGGGGGGGGGSFAGITTLGGWSWPPCLCERMCWGTCKFEAGVGPFPNLRALGKPIPRLGLAAPPRLPNSAFWGQNWFGRCFGTCTSGPRLSALLVFGWGKSIPWAGVDAARIYGPFSTRFTARFVARPSGKFSLKTAIVSEGKF